MLSMHAHWLEQPRFSQTGRPHCRRHRSAPIVVSDQAPRGTGSANLAEGLGKLLVTGAGGVQPLPKPTADGYTKPLPGRVERRFVEPAHRSRQPDRHRFRSQVTVVRSENGGTARRGAVPPFAFPRVSSG